MLGLLLAFRSVKTQAGVMIGGTRVIYDGNKKDTLASVCTPKNSGVYLVQTWVDSGKSGGQIYCDTTAVRIFVSCIIGIFTQNAKRGSWE